MTINKSHYRSEMCHVIIKLMSFILFLSIFYFHKQKGGERQTKIITYNMCILSFWGNGIHKNFSEHLLLQKVERVPQHLP